MSLTLMRDGGPSKHKYAFVVIAEIVEFADIIYQRYCEKGLSDRRCAQVESSTHIFNHQLTIDQGAMSRAAGPWGVDVRATAHADLFGTLDKVHSAYISLTLK